MSFPWNITNPGFYIDGLLTSVESQYVTDLVLASSSASENEVLTWKSGAPSWEALAAGSGDVVGPASAVDSNFAAFNLTTGKIIKDSGSKASDFATAGHNHDGVYAPALGPDDNYVTDAEKVAIGTIGNKIDAIADPNADRILFWDDSAGAYAYLTASTGLTISTTSMTVRTSSATQTGIVELATNAEAVTGTDTARAVTPANLTARLAAPGEIGGTTPASVTATTVTTTGNIELGHASDTTLSRVSAGVIAVEGVNIVTESATQTLTNKTLTSPTFTGTVTLPTALTGVLRADTGVVSVDTDVTDIVAAASDTAAGKVELAIASEVNTGTDATRAITPDALAGSNFGIRYVSFQLNATTALTTSEKAYWRVPAAFTGMNLVTVGATVGTGAAGSSSSGTPTFTVKNVTDNNQMLSTNLTVDANEYTSATAATAAVINTSFDDVVTDDLLEVACTVAGTGTTYAVVTLGFALP